MTIRFNRLRNSTRDKRPEPTDINPGRLAQNQSRYSPGLYMRDEDGNVVKVGPAQVSTLSPNDIPTGHAGNSLGELWINQNDKPAILYFFDGVHWEPATGFQGGNVIANNLNGGIFGDRNEIINPTFSQNPRWPADITATGIVSENWRLQTDNSAVAFTSSVVTNDATQLNGTSQAGQFRLTPGTTASRYARIAQAIEGQARRYAGQDISLSFRAKSSVPMKIVYEVVSLPTGLPEVPIIGPTVIDLTTSWQLFSASAQIPGASVVAPAAGNLWVRFWFDAGSDFAATRPGLGTTAGDVLLTNVQFERGSRPTLFSPRKSFYEGMLCANTYQTLWLANYVANAKAGETIEASSTFAVPMGSLNYNSGATGVIREVGTSSTFNVSGLVYSRMGQGILATGVVNNDGPAKLRALVSFDRA